MPYPLLQERLDRAIREEVSMSRKKAGTVSRAACVVLLMCFLAASLSGCTLYHPLRLPQLREFEQNVRREYPLSAVSCKYEYGTGVSITVSGMSFEEECAYTILGYLQPIVCDEDFIQDLFELFEKESHGDHNWKLGMRPDIRLHLAAGTNDRYQFTARATKELYNSGRDPDSYTWDGYATWYGTEFVGSLPREITPKEIGEAVKRYCKA